MSISVSIPVEIGGYTGQRDQWESSTHDYAVAIEDDERIVLESNGYSSRKIWFDLDDLLKAVELIKTQEGAREILGPYEGVDLP